MSVRSCPPREPAVAASLLPLAPAWDIALIYQVPLHPEFLMIAPEGVSIELQTFHEMMKINLKSQVLMYVSCGEMHCFLAGAIV